MVQYNDDLKQEIRNANDIVDVISQYVILKRSGKNFMGLCPFHREKSPSFSVSPDRQYYHCFGCHKGGDVFNFIMEIEHLSFKEAIEFLAERGHIKLPVNSNNEEFNQKQYLIDRMNKINMETATFYHERLYTPVAKVAQDYVKKRKLDNRTLKAFKIGYSGEYNELYKFLKQKGYKENEILATGLVNKNERGDFIDRFRKRLMFPIISVYGKPVAFGGRKLDDSDKKVAKYINSNENFVYSKKKHLFALNLAKQSQSDKIILVEGYMDAISLYQRGFDNVVASLGTALTEEQANLLRKYGKRIIFAYDSDGAGQTAIMRGIEVLEKQNCDARVLQMEGAKDPDEYIIKNGSGRFNMLVENAISLVEFQIKMLKDGYNLNNTKDKINFLKKITAILSKIDDKIEREIYIDKISSMYDISKQALYAEVNKVVYNENVEKILVQPPKKIVKIDENVKKVDEKLKKRENMLIYIMINNPKESINLISSNIGIDDLKIEENKIIFEKIISSNEFDSDRITQIISNIEDSKIQEHISEIMVADYEITSVQKCIDDLIIMYAKERLQERKNEILKELENIDLTKDEMARLEAELSDIIVKLAKVK